MATMLTDPPTMAAAPQLALPPDEEAREIAVDAFIYGYPMVLMEMSRRAMLDTPMNRFSHRPDFPDASFTDVVRPNADTLYSKLWYDVSRDPLLISVPDSRGRYYLLPMLDMWTDVFAAPGARTSGTAPQIIALVGPRWQGALPEGVQLIRSPTAMGWIIGRTQTNGPGDYDHVHHFQEGLRAVSLGALSGDPAAPTSAYLYDPSTGPVPPVDRVSSLSAENFLALLCDLSRDNPPHPGDYSMLMRMKRIGVEPGRSFRVATLSTTLRLDLDTCWAAAKALIVGRAERSGDGPGGWRTHLSGVGAYGNDYLHRASIAYSALGANSPEDAVYPTSFADAEGRPYSSERRYLLHFDRDEIPPVRAFWSLTLYNDSQLFAENSLHRYALGDRDPLRYNGDGSLDIYIQRDSPGPERESNWLPAPRSGGFSMNMRLYWPSASVLAGEWSPPPVRAFRSA
jgi:hypothetical protein